MRRFAVVRMGRKAHPYTIITPMRARFALTVAASGLVLTALGGLSSWRSPGPRALDARAEPVRIEVRRPREDLIMTREAGGPWVVARQDDVADSEAVELLLGGLRSLTFGPPVASSAEGLASGLGPADSARVRVLDEAGHVLFDGLFGRRALSRTCYFRAYDRDEVRLATGVDPELLQRSTGQWREPRLLPGGCAEGLEVFKRGKWTAVPRDRASALCAARAAHWATGTPEGLAGFDRPLLRARTPDGRGFTVGDLRGRERLVRVDGRSSLLRVNAAAIETAAGDLVNSVP